MRIWKHSVTMELACEARSIISAELHWNQNAEKGDRMPHVTVRGVDEQELRQISGGLKQVVVTAAQVQESYVKIFYSPIRRVDAEEEVAVDVYWMPRPQETCDRVAEAITDYLTNQGKGFVQVTFTEFPGNHFYEDKLHF